MGGLSLLLAAPCLLTREPLWEKGQSILCHEGPSGRMGLWG